nr:MAG TPA: hypothetical protein [Caudoviricetes sp.]
MKVIAKKNRELALINARNTQNENRAETIELVVPEEYENYNKKIVFITSDGNVWDVITNNEYKITNAITKYKQVDFYIWLTKEVDGESIDFRTKTKTLSFYHNEDASDEITDEEIHGVNTVVNLLEEEIEKVENLNIEATKIGDTTTVTITKKDGTTESVEINDGVDGQDGYTPQKGIDYFTEQDIEEIETDVKNDLEENVLVNYSLIAETGAKIELSINQTNYKLTAILKDKNNNIIHTSNVIDLPLETMVVNATYDNTTKKIILTLQNGTTVEFSVADLVSGLVSESQLQTILANYYTKTEINNLLANKVDKVAGKGLSTNDFTDEYKEQVDTNTEDIEDIQDEQTEQNTDIEKLQTENARLKATLPTTGEVTGQDITLDKTAEMEFTKPPLPMGNSEQVTKILPEGYTQVEYIESTGTQYIDTNYLFNNVDLEIKFQSSSDYPTEQILLGGRDYAGSITESKDFTIWLHADKNKIGIHNMKIDTKYQDCASFLEPSILEYKVNNLENEIYMNNTLVYSFSGIDTNVCEKSTYLFGARTDDYLDSRTFKGKIYYLKVSKDNEIVKYYIPCKNSNNEIGMYDLVTNTFFGNSGTGTFVAGNEVAIPNPDYPQEITNVTGDVEVVVQNKNEWNKDGINFNGHTGIDNFNAKKVILDSAIGKNAYSLLTYNTRCVAYFKGEIGLSYNVSMNSGFVITAIKEIDDNGIITSTINSSNITLTQKSFAVMIRKSDSSDFTDSEATKLKDSIQIEPGSTATTYTPHKEQTFTFPLGNIELCKIGDYQDYFYKESNKWYLHKEISKKILDGTENWQYYNGVQYITSIIDYKANGLICKCSHYIAQENVNTSVDVQDKHITFRNNSSNSNLYIKDSDYNNSADFKTWLSTHNLQLYYALEQPTDTEITDTTLISQLEAINNAISYEEQTNISSNTIALFNVEAYQDAKVILAEKGTYSKPSTGIPKSDLASAVQTSLNKADTSIQQHQDISGKQDKTDNNLTTINKTIVGAINEVDSIAKGANQALSYGNYSTMITAFNSLANDVYNIGQNVMIITLEVPDLWISGIESTSSSYSYVDDETFVNELKTNGYVQVGYYKLSALETQKVNLDDYVTKTENKNKADIINNELTGSTIYFTDGINNSPVNKLIVNIEPVQEGSGTPSPINVRNITGWNGVIINHSGADTQNPDTLNISWQNEAGIVYGGTLNVITGLFTVTKALVELAVEDMNNTETYPGWKNTGIESIIGIGINQKFTSILNVGDTFSANTTSGTGTIFLPRSAYGLTQEQWKEQYPNLTIQIIAEYQNPETYQLTSHEIRTLLGINNFWANTGDVTVNYKADTKLYIDSKFQSLEDRLSLLEG